MQLSWLPERQKKPQDQHDSLAMHGRTALDSESCNKALVETIVYSALSSAADDEGRCRIHFAI